MVAPAWALPRGPNVLLCVAVSGPVSYEWSAHFADLWVSRPPGTARFKLPPYVIDQAREIGAELAVNQNAQWLFYLDSDVLPPPDTIQRLMAHNKPIVSAFYARRHPPLHPLLLKRVSDNPLKFDLIRNFPVGSLVEVDACPAGCMLVKTDVLRRIPKPWFSWTAGRAIEGVSEDYYFTWKAKQEGFRTFVDTSLKVQHEGHFAILPQDDMGVQVLTENPNP